MTMSTDVFEHFYPRLVTGMRFRCSGNGLINVSHQRVESKEAVTWADQWQPVKQEAGGFYDWLMRNSSQEFRTELVRYAKKMEGLG